MRYFAHTSSTVDAMLKVVGKASLDDLHASIPGDARIKFELQLPKKLDEYALKRKLQPFQAPNPYRSFLGAGATAHFVPEWVSQQLMRAEWYTSYTPYQAEASQGTLQAIFEFQSMVASLFGLGVANASMYDGATALVEALLMAIRATKKRCVILSKTLHPEYRETAQTYLPLASYQPIEIGFGEDGHTCRRELATAIAEAGGDLAAIAIQSPNFFGRVEDMLEMAELAHKAGALFIAVTTDVSANAILPSPGSNKADIAVGEGLSFVGGISLGGPGVGLLACNSSLLRQMPGRLVGHTTDKSGRTGYVLTLSTREQHIRREKATSNICTNHNLMALAFSMALASYGKSGFLELAKTNIKKTLLFRRALKMAGLDIAFPGSHYNETVVRFRDQSALDQRLQVALKHNIIAGLPLTKFYPKLEGHLLVAITELHDDEDIRELALILAGEKND